jgi:hypothetical protein
MADGDTSSVSASASSASSASAVVCRLTGRLGVHTSRRAERPRPVPRRRFLPDDLDGCVLCHVDGDDPRLLALRASHGAATWFGLRNLFPPVEGGTGRADLAVAERHAPSLTHPHAGRDDEWAAMLDVLRRLARRAPDRWSMLTAATGVSAGASQAHPHGQAVTPARTPPEVVDRQHRWTRPEVVAQAVADEVTVAERDGVRLVAPAVPLGPLDLRLVPVAAAVLDDLDVEVVAALVGRWLDGALALAGEVAPGDAAPSPAAAPPLDAKLALHPPLPDGTGRWWAELYATDHHAPGVAEVPIVDLHRTPRDHAAVFRGVAG